jgi:hypothetical protein
MKDREGEHAWGSKLKKAGEADKIKVSNYWVKLKI